MPSVGFLANCPVTLDITSLHHFCAMPNLGVLLCQTLLLLYGKPKWYSLPNLGIILRQTLPFYFYTTPSTGYAQHINTLITGLCTCGCS